MAFRDILLLLDTYPEPTPASAIDDAVVLSQAMGAKISALACAIMLPGTGNILADTLLDVPKILVEEGGKSLSNAEAVLSRFQRAAEERGIFQERILERFPKLAVSDLFIEHARVRDLSIVPIPEEETVGRLSAQSMVGYAEQIVFGSGRPTIFLRRNRISERKVAIDTVIVGWDCSRPASRAVADALPILEVAKQVIIVKVTSTKPAESKASAAALARNLTHHGVRVVQETVDADGQEIGDVLLNYVASSSADLLVMGAYGTSRLRETVFGGTTRSLLARSSTPILLAH
jgi:nucleotide-binding universal stress UspA family protein